MKLFQSLILLTVLLISCEKVDLTAYEEQGAPSTVRLITRAADGETFDSPLYAYGFNTGDGSLITSRQLSSEGFTLTLPQQTDSRIVILSADPESYDIPTSPSLSSLITMKAPTAASSSATVPDVSPSGSLAKGYATSPLQMGFIDVNPQSDNSTVTVQMHYQVASLSVHLQGLPHECTSAYISVASPANGLTLSGTTDGTQTTRIPLAAVPDPVGEPAESTPSGKTFATTAPVYLFPTTTPTTFTIAYNDAEGEQYASATYQAPLKSGTPYQLNGTYNNGSFLLSGTVTPSEWADPVSLSFTFSNDGNTIITQDDTPVPEDSSEIYPVTTIPQPLTLWNGHLVIAAVSESATVPDGSPSGSTATITLLSLSDWSNLTSALNTATPTEAPSIAQGYTEYDLTGWRIPTEAEARTISQLYRENTDTFDSLLFEAKATPIVLTDDKGNNLRYLCEDALKTYSFKNSTITNAGATVKNYHLRLVRTVRVQQQ